MYFQNGGINTCFLFGFAEATSPIEMRLHVISDDRTALPVRCDGARLPAYPFEPVILAGSLVFDEAGEPLFLARHTLAASKSHVPRKLSWSLDRCANRLAFTPVNPDNRYKLHEEILAPLPDQVDWPEEIRAFALREGGLFEDMLTQPLSQKRCWGIALIAGFAELRDLVEGEDEAPTAMIRFRLRPEKQAAFLPTKMSLAVAGGRTALTTLRLRDPRRSPVAAVVRPSLILDPSPGDSGTDPEARRHRWGLRVEALQEAGAAEIRDPRTFLARARQAARPEMAA